MGTPELQLLCDELAIRKVLAEYCRAVDRCDQKLLKSVYWPDAVDNHGVFSGNAWEFADFVMPLLRQMQRTMHQISNVLIELNSDRANVETYVCAYHLMETEQGPTDVIFLGRYLERFERRKGEWRIADRLVVMDWNRNHPATVRWEGDIYGPMKTHGQRHPTDASYQAFGDSWLT
jgi:hypothetical protein